MRLARLFAPTIAVVLFGTAASGCAGIPAPLRPVLAPVFPGVSTAAFVANEAKLKAQTEAAVTHVAPLVPEAARLAELAAAGNWPAFAVQLPLILAQVVALAPQFRADFEAVVGTLDAMRGELNSPAVDEGVASAKGISTKAVEADRAQAVRNQALDDAGVPMGDVKRGIKPAAR